MNTLIALSLSLIAAPADADYFPLTTGNEWTYSTSLGQSFTLRVTGTAKVGGVDCTVLETDMAGQKMREYFAITDQGVKSYKVENPLGVVEFPEPILRVKLPFKKGDRWQATIQEGFSRNTYQYECEGPETLTFAGAPVECMKVGSTLTTVQGTAKTTAWFGRGLGLVKQVNQVGFQSMTAELVKTNVNRAPPPPAAPAPAPASPVAVEADRLRYVSKDGKVLLFHPTGWKVAEGDMFGEGTYSVTVDAPDENAGILFMTFAVNAQLKDSMEIAKTVLGSLRNVFTNLTVSDMSSTKDRARTTAKVTFLQGQKKVAGHMYFFHTPRAGTVYALMAREDLWPSMRGVLTSIVANLAYAPDGVARVLEQGQKAAVPPTRPGGQRVLHPAVMIKEALARPGKQIELTPVVAQDGSFSMAVPRGWTFQGAALAWSAVSDSRALHGAGSVWHTVYVPGSGLAQFGNGMESRFLPPAQAIAYIAQAQKTARNVRVLSACANTDLDPNADAVWNQARAQGSTVDSSVLLIESENVATGQTCRGIYTVTCIAYPMGVSWSCAVEGSWAPAGEYEEYIPLYAKVFATVKQNEQWVSQKFQAQAAESRRLNQNLMNSIQDLNRSYDRYNQSWWESQKSRDYTSWAFSQTTLGQGSWVSEREGAEVVRSSSWGLENLETGEKTPAWNHTNFTGQNPWTGEQLNEVNTRAEYEQYIRGQ